VLPPEEQIPDEPIRIGQHLKVLLLEERKRSRGAQVTVSRAHKALVRRLLEFEIPELTSGAVVIRALAREPGVRTKVAVSATQDGIDPVGACVGPRGVRIRSVVGELGSERVDIIPWADEPAQLVANALSPAQVLNVEIDRESRTATAHVPENQLSLAIGKDGQNARLAAKLTGWRIDIKPTVEGPHPDPPPHAGEGDSEGARPDPPPEGKGDAEGFRPDPPPEGEGTTAVGH